MNFFTVSSFLIIITTFTMAVFLFYGGKSKKTSLLWGYFGLVVSIWGLGAFKVSLAKSMESAYFWWQFANISSVLTPSIFCHFVLVYLGKPKKNFITSIYCIAFCFLMINFFARHLFIGELSFMFNQFYYIDWTNLRTPLYLIFYIFFYWILLLYSFSLLLKRFFHSRGVERNQLKYFILGMMIGFFGAHLLWLPAFGVPVYPYSNILIAFYPIIVGYAILRYRLLDISIAITRAGIFLVVYSLVLGFPLWIGYKYHLWQQATWAMLVLATIGPSIYLYLQRRAEERLEHEEIRLERFLKDLSNGMNDIKDLQRLLDFIVDLLVRGMKIANSALYLLEIHDEKQHYVLKSSNIKDEIVPLIDVKSPLIHELEKREPLLYEELKLDSDRNSHKMNLEGALSQMEALHTHVIMPIVTGDTLLGFITLGERRDKKIYSQRVLNSLSILANNSASAIENCKYWAEKMKQMEEEGLLARISSLDNMANSMAHVIGNPVHIISMALGNAKHSLKRDLRISMPSEVKTDILESLDRSEQAAERIGGIINAILDYSRRGTGKMEPFNVNEAMKGFLFLIEPLITHSKVKFTHDIEPNLPVIIGNKIHLEEIIMYFVTNSLHAVKKKEEGRITLKIFRKDNDTLRIECRDNGYGISPKKIKDIFLAYETSKGADGVKKNEGFGLGLFRARKIVDLYKGNIWAESEGEGKGAAFIVELPIVNINKL